MPQVNGNVGSRLLTDDVIAQEALLRLKNMMVLAPLVYRDHTKMFNGKNGESVSIRLPVRFKHNEGRELTSGDYKGLVDQTVPIVIDRDINVPVKIETRDRRLSAKDFGTRILQPALQPLATALDRAIALELSKAHVAMANRVGYSLDPQNGFPSVHRAMTVGSAQMTAMAVPDDGMRFAVLNPMTCASITSDVARIDNNSDATKAFKSGYEGNVAGFDTYKSNNLGTHTTGDWSTSTPVFGALQADGKVTFTGITPNGTAPVLRAGDTFVIADVGAINPDNYEATGRPAMFVVLEDVTANNQAVEIYPKINDGSLTIDNKAGESISMDAYQNVTAAPVSGATVIPFGAPATTYQQDYLFHKNAVALQVIALDHPDTAPVAKTVKDERSGLSIQMTGQYDINQRVSLYRFDLVFGVKIIYGELATKMYNNITEDETDFQ